MACHTIFVKINGRKDYDARKDHKTKVPFQKDGLYECLMLTAWARYLNFAFRVEEVYYFLGNREPLYNMETKEDLELKIVFERIISKVDKDFTEVLKDAQDFYNKQENFYAYYNWITGGNFRIPQSTL